MNLNDINLRCVDWNLRGQTLRLRPVEWQILEKFDGYRTLREILEAERLDLAMGEAVARKLAEAGLIATAELTWDEFLARFPRPVPAVAATAPAPTVPREPATLTAPNPLPAQRSEVTFAISAPRGSGSVSGPAPIPSRGEPLAVVAAEAPVRFKIGAPRVTPPPATIEGPVSPDTTAPENPPTVPIELGTSSEEDPLPLRDVLEFIMRKSGGGTKGQLAIYRTFLKVPMQMLRESGIKSVNVVDTDIQVRDPAFRGYLLRAVESVVGEPFLIPT